MNLFDGLFNADLSKNTTTRKLEWRCLHVELKWSWTDIQNYIDEYIAIVDENHTTLQNETPVE